MLLEELLKLSKELEHNKQILSNLTREPNSLTLGFGNGSSVTVSDQGLLYVVTKTMHQHLSARIDNANLILGMAEEALKRGSIKEM